MLYFRLILTQPQIEELNQACKKARCLGFLTVVNRILAVLAYTQRDRSFETIADVLRDRQEFVKAWVKKYIDYFS